MYNGMIAKDFKSDVTALDIEQLLKFKEWDALTPTPEIDAEIEAWLMEHTPIIWAAAVEFSKKKDHKQYPINFIKIKLCIEQTDLLGLKSLNHGRFLNILAKCQPFLNSKLLSYIKTENYNFVKLLNQESMLKAYIFDLRVVGQTQANKIAQAFKENPEIKGLEFLNNVVDEIKLLTEISESVELVEHQVLDRSAYNVCSFCFRAIRLKPSNRSQIAYHGYTKKFDSIDITGDTCKGANYPSLFESAEGTFVALESKLKQLDSLAPKIDEVANGYSDLSYEEKYNRKKEAYLYRNGLLEIEYFFETALKYVEKYQPDSLGKLESLIKLDTVHQVKEKLMNFIKSS